jgi:hypothetical protein
MGVEEGTGASAGVPVDGVDLGLGFVEESRDVDLLHLGRW